MEFRLQNQVFCKTTIIRQLRKRNESKIEKLLSKTLVIL